MVATNTKLRFLIRRYSSLRGPKQPSFNFVTETAIFRNELMRGLATTEPVIFRNELMRDVATFSSSQGYSNATLEYDIQGTRLMQGVYFD